jgi:alpha-beta hydrolase superfamily lysophospholipase
MKKDVEFKTQDGVTLAAWHYLPDQSSGKVPTIVMAHGFSAVREMYLDKFAEVFAAAGLGALVFDNRNFGASGGEPRQERSAITAMRSRSRRHFRRPTQIALASGDPATAVATCWSSARSTAGLNAWPGRCP